MPIVLANQSKARLIDSERMFLNSCKIRLFTVNYVPVGAMILTDFQPYPGDTGLSVINSPVFASAVLNGANQGELLAPTITWTASFSAGAITIYGYFVYDATTSLVVYAERASVPFTVSGAGQTYSVTPRKQMDTMLG